VVPSPDEPRQPADAPVVLDAGSTDEGGVDLDTGDADRAATAVLVARARMEGAGSFRTREPAAARRAVTVIDAILAARRERGTLPAGVEGAPAAAPASGEGRR